MGFGMGTPTYPKSPSDLKRTFLRMWLGSWADRPKGDSQQHGLKLAKEEVIVTPSRAIISPAAIAVIDVLGMSALLKGESLETIAEKVAGPLFDLDGEAYKFGNVGLTEGQLRSLGFRRQGGKVAGMFADTIVLAQRPIWECGNSAIAAAAAVVELARYVCKITAVNALQQIWLRSAIAYGDCLLSASQTPIFLGSPIREAFYWEKRQDWSGGMLTPSALATFETAIEVARKSNTPDSKPDYPEWLVTYKVPLKRDKRVASPNPLIALNWRSFHAIGAHAWLRQDMPKLGGLPTEVVLKFRNTIRFCKIFRNHGQRQE